MFGPSFRSSFRFVKIYKGVIPLEGLFCDPKGVYLVTSDLQGVDI